MDQRAGGQHSRARPVTTWNYRCGLTSPKYLNVARPDICCGGFEFDRFCGSTCDRVRQDQASEPEAPRCLATASSLHVRQTPRTPINHRATSILISQAGAADAIRKQPLPVFGADSEIPRILSATCHHRPDADWRCQRLVPSLTATGRAAGRGQDPAQRRSRQDHRRVLVLDTNSASVVGNCKARIAFSEASIEVTTASGKPQCAVNPTIAKPSTSFVFHYRLVRAMPSHPACTGVRAIVLSLDDVNPIADQSVLYTCVVEAPPTAAVGVFALHASAVANSDPGSLLPAVAVDERVSRTAQRANHQPP